MAKDQPRRVQQMVFQFVFGRDRIDSGSVNRVADNRMPHLIAMNSQLMRASGERFQFDESMRPEPALDAINRLRRFAAFALWHYTPMRPDFRIAAYWRVDFARILFHAPA